MNDDLEQLQLLAIFHYVVAAMTGLFALFPIIHLVIGIAAVTGHLDNGRAGDHSAALFGWFFIAIAAVWMITGFAFTVCLLLAGRFLAHHRRYLFCLVIACVACTFVPFGTALGVFTIIVLMRPSTKALFAQVHP
jgi:hypothetical protein